MPDVCARSTCKDAPLEGLDVCGVHHQEILMGLDECKAQDCDVRVPFGSLWCKPHAALRLEGGLSASGELLNVPVESVACRICGAPALKRTVGVRPQGGWNDLCQEHYDEKRAAHSRSLAVAREHLGNGKAEDASAAPRRVEIPVRLLPRPEAAPRPPEIDETQRRTAYLLAHDWATGGHERWFLPVNVTQPAEGRTLDEAYEWQVGLEAGRHSLELTSGTAPDRDAHAPGCMLDTDHDGECDVSGAPDGLIDLSTGRPMPAGAEITSHDLTPVMTWEVRDGPTPAQRVLEAYAVAVADALSAWGCELATPESEIPLGELAAHTERLLTLAPGIRTAVELLDGASE